MKRSLVLTMFAAAVVTLFITAREARSSDPGDAGSTCPVPTAAAAPAGSVFSGCWSFFSTGACRAVYRDAAGNYSLCGKCGPTGEPNPNGCSAISAQTLAVGFWCS